MKDRDPRARIREIFIILSACTAAVALGQVVFVLTRGL